jgi:hypothetical protein
MALTPFTGAAQRESRNQAPVFARRNSIPEGSGFIDARVLAANTSEAHAVPAGARYVNFSANADFYARFQSDNTAITVPAADVTNGSAPAFKPGMREIPEGTTHILLIAPATTVVTLEFWS